jgi:hypothetical protein
VLRREFVNLCYHRQSNSRQLPRPDCLMRDIFEAYGFSVTKM